MNIRRQYSLPNCILTLDGLDTTGEAGGSRPCLSVLLQAKCQFPMDGQGFECDRDFFEHFARTLSLYGQQVISGVRSPDLSDAPELLALMGDEFEDDELELESDSGAIATQAPPKASPAKPEIDLAVGPIQVYPIGTSNHRLWIQPPPPMEGAAPPPPLDMELSTLQLFDVVEVIDQFFADTRTLPDVTLGLTSVSRRYLVAREPLAQRILPVVIGASTLTAAAGALFLLPHPGTVERPEDIFRDAEEFNQPALPVPGSGTPPQADPESSPTLTPLEGPSPSTTGRESAPEGSSGSDEAEDGAEDATTEDTDQSSAPRSSVAIAQAPEPRAAESGTASASDEGVDISNPELLSTLNTALRESIDEVWEDRKAVKQDLEYQVGVSVDGKVVGYRPVNAPARQLRGDRRLPLRKILFNPVQAETAKPQPNEPLAVFKVVLTDEGVPQVSPLRGFQGELVSTPAQRPERPGE